LTLYSFYSFLLRNINVEKCVGRPFHQGTHNVGMILFCSIIFMKDLITIYIQRNGAHIYSEWDSDLCNSINVPVKVQLSTIKWFTEMLLLSALKSLCFLQNKTYTTTPIGKMIIIKSYVHSPHSLQFNFTCMLILMMVNTSRSWVKGKTFCIKSYQLY
jgi:hypothetical protein